MYGVQIWLIFIVKMWLYWVPFIIYIIDPLTHQYLFDNNFLYFFHSNNSNCEVDKKKKILIWVMSAKNVNLLIDVGSSKIISNIIEENIEYKNSWMRSNWKRVIIIISHVKSDYARIIIQNTPPWLFTRNLRFDFCCTYFFTV